MKLTAYLIVITLLASCMTTKKATDFLERKGALAGICAEAFPVKDSLHTREREESDTTVNNDTVYVTDTIYVEGKTIAIKRQCPASQTITKTIYRDSIHYQTNTAEVKVWQQKADSLFKVIAGKDKVIAEKENTISVKEAKIKDLTDSRNQWRKWCLITCLIVAAYIVLKVWRPVQLPFKI